MIVDASASMAFPQPSLDKWRLAREVAVALAAVAYAEGDPVGLSVATESPVVLTPRARRSVLIEMIRALDTTKPAGSMAIAPFVANSRSPRVVVISDLLGDADAIMAAARLRIATRGEVVIVHVVATEELDPPRDAMLAVDPEAPETRRILDGALREEYLNQFTRWLDETAATSRAAGVRYVRALTNEPAPHIIRRIAGDTTRRG
jgi:uncharacterized protein (DUF58 family)